MEKNQGETKREKMERGGGGEMKGKRGISRSWNGHFNENLCAEKKPSRTRLGEVSGGGEERIEGSRGCGVISER